MSASVTNEFMEYASIVIEVHLDGDGIYVQVVGFDNLIDVRYGGESI